tara:strand:- start:204 stop:488 length:285 start_codon:yes stop_codon:yes gene_type:complete
MIDITATMESVRFMFNKHLKKIDLSVQTKIKPEKDYKYKPKLSDEVVLNVRHDLERGKTLVKSAKDNGISTTTAYKIKHYEGCFGRGIFARNTT